MIGTIIILIIQRKKQVRERNCDYSNFLWWIRYSMDSEAIWNTTKKGSILIDHHFCLKDYLVKKII